MYKRLSSYIIFSFLFFIQICIGQQYFSKQAGFDIKKIDDELHTKMLRTNVFDDYSPVSIDRLRLLRVAHFGFDGEIHEGEMVVLDACSKQVLTIFKNLFERQFPLASVNLMTEYNGSDSLSMADNNTSGHNLRRTTGGKRLSLHAYGTAIDINPVNNPYISIPCNENSGKVEFQPLQGIKFANRMKVRLGKSDREGLAEEVLDVFAENGFYWWGGYWDCPIDYQHFQLSRAITLLLVDMEPQEAGEFFEKVVRYFNKHNKPIEDAMKEKMGKAYVELYQNNQKQFYAILDEIY